jgi:signal transduction histidine kinase/ActR/RegA family two-component response regulator
VIDVCAIDVRREDDVVRAHQLTRTFAAGLGFSTFEQTRIATAMSEIARNALTYAGSGTVALRVDEVERVFVVIVADRGPGIEDVDAALRGERRANAAQGVGIPGSRRLVDELEIDSTPAGTRVVLRKRLARRAGPLDGAQIQKLRSQLAEQRADDPALALQRLQRDVAERDHKLAELGQELAETNRGVIALYAELEERADLQRRATELKNRLLNEMGHELRTPLHSVLSISRFLLDRLDGDLTVEQERQVEIIHHVAASLTAYVNDLLDLAKTDAGKVPVVVAWFSVDSLFNTIRWMMQPLVTNPAVTLHFTAAADIPPLVTDESKLSQILRNLVANALKFTDAGHVTVRAHAHGDDVVFEIEDTGVGIAPEHHALIFEEFAQVEGAVPRRTRGTGLGLPLSQRLVELLGGHIDVASTPGIGSVFTVRLPRAYHGEAAPPPTEVVEPHVVSVRPIAGQPRILIIDDDEASRYVLHRWLAERYRVVEAVSGHEGLRLAAPAAGAAERPDAIFLDVLMPDLTGFEVLERLKEAPATAGIPIIVYTSLALGTADRKRLDRAVAIVRKSTVSRIADRTAIEEALVKAGLALHVPTREPR